MKVCGRCQSVDGRRVRDLRITIRHSEYGPRALLNKATQLCDVCQAQVVSEVEDAWTSAVKGRRTDREEKP